MTMLGTSAKAQGAKKAGSAGMTKAKHNPIFLIVFTLILLLFSGIYLRYKWNKYEKIASSEVIHLAQSLASIFHSEHISAISGNADDLSKPEYLMAKNSLIKLVNATNPIHFAYFLAERDSQLVFLFDSESTDSPNHIPPGQVFGEADDIFRQPFRTGNTVLANQVTDPWGTWVSVLVPVIDPSEGSIISVLVMNISATEWFNKLHQQMIPETVIVTCVLILCLAFMHIRVQNKTLKILNKKISYDEVLYRSIFSQAPIGIAIIKDWHFITQSESGFGEVNINPMFKKILGRTSSELEMTTWPEITHPDDLPEDMAKFEQFKKGEIGGYTMEKRFIRPDGSIVWTNMKISPLIGLPYEHSRHLCLLEDISVSMKTYEALSESERSKSVLLSHLPGLAYRCSYDREWTMEFVSNGCFDLTGYPAESLLYNREMSFNSIIAPEYRDALWREWEHLLASNSTFKYEYEIITANKERKWVLEMGQGVYNEQGEVEALEGIILDISDRKKMENDLRYINEHDSLTGLYNGRFLENLLTYDAKELNANKRALIGINLSTINSLTLTYGFHYTQELIIKVSDLLKQFCTEQRMLFYTYWNRFVFYLQSYQTKEELLEFCTNISQLLDSLLKTERIDGGIGILEIDSNDTDDADELLKKLLIASEKSLTNPEADFNPCFYDANIEAAILRKEHIKQELANVVDDDNAGALYLQYQPIVDLKSNQIQGLEALARLKSDKLGLVSPLEFILLAEETKLIIPLGDKIIRQALSFLAKLKNQGYEEISVSINVSVIQLLRNDFVENLFAMIHEMQVRPENIGIELTESIYADSHKEVNETINQLRIAGIHVAIDDFGTGYSSLAREQDLSVDCLKIDKHFIDKLIKNNPENAITRDIISMAHKLGHYVIAEGVEQEKQLKYLKQWNCDRVQGYFISKPLDEERTIEFLAEHFIRE